MVAGNDPNAPDRERPDREREDGLEHRQGGAADEQATAEQTGGPRPPGSPDEAARIDRDALHQADYGGARGPAELPDPPPGGEEQQGGASSDEASGGGRKPTGDRDRDYDPDGDRTGL